MIYLIVRVFRGRNNVLLNHMKKMFIEVKSFKTKINSLEVKLHNMQHSYLIVIEQRTTFHLPLSGNSCFIKKGRGAVFYSNPRYNGHFIFLQDSLQYIYKHIPVQLVVINSTY